MRVPAPIRACFGSGFLPLLLLGVCALFVGPHGKAVHARVPTSRSVRTASRSSESYLMVDRHEGKSAQSAAFLGPSFRHKDHPPGSGKAPAVWITFRDFSRAIASPSRLPRGSLDADPPSTTVSVRSPRGPPFFA